jgi:hypothetical protein
LTLDGRRGDSEAFDGRAVDQSTLRVVRRHSSGAKRTNESSTKFTNCKNPT